MLTESPTVCIQVGRRVQIVKVLLGKQDSPWSILVIHFLLAHLSSAQGELLWSLECPSFVVRRRQQFVYTLGATFLVQSSSNLVRVFVLMMAWTLLNMGVVGSKSRSLGQILEKACLHSSSHISSNFLRIFILYDPTTSIIDRIHLLIKTNILSKFEEDWTKNVTTRV